MGEDDTNIRKCALTLKCFLLHYELKTRNGKSHFSVWVTNQRVHDTTEVMQ